MRRCSLPFSLDMKTAEGELGSTGEVELTIRIDGVPVTGLSGATFTSSAEAYTASAGFNAATGAKIVAEVVGASLDPGSYISRGPDE